MGASRPDAIIALHTATPVRKPMAAGMVNLGKTHNLDFAYDG